MPKEYIYYSNDSQVLKEYIFIIYSKSEPSNIGFVVTLVADKSKAKVVSHNDFALSTEFNPAEAITSIPNVKFKGAWPRKLALSSTYTQDGQRLKLNEENIEAIMNIQDHIGE